jgi:hypothetical protein
MVYIGGQPGAALGKREVFPCLPAIFRLIVEIRKADPGQTAIGDAKRVLEDAARLVQAVTASGGLQCACEACVKGRVVESHGIRPL